LPNPLPNNSCSPSLLTIPARNNTLYFHVLIISRGSLLIILQHGGLNKLRKLFLAVCGRTWIAIANSSNYTPKTHKDTLHTSCMVRSPGQILLFRTKIYRSGGLWNTHMCTEYIGKRNRLAIHHNTIDEVLHNPRQRRMRLHRTFLYISQGL